MYRIHGWEVIYVTQLELTSRQIYPTASMIFFLAIISITWLELQLEGT